MKTVQRITFNYGFAVCIQFFFMIVCIRVYINCMHINEKPLIQLPLCTFYAFVFKLLSEKYAIFIFFIIIASYINTVLYHPYCK